MSITSITESIKSTIELAREKYEELFGDKEEKGRFRLTENEIFEPYFTATVKKEVGGQNLSIEIRKCRELARVNALTLEGIIEIFELDQSEITEQSFRDEVKHFKETNEFWGRKFSENEAKTLLMLVESLKLKQNDIQNSESELKYDLAITRHENLTHGGFLNLCCLLPKGVNLPSLGDPVQLSKCSLAAKLLLVIPVAALELILILAIIMPGAYTFFTENLFLAWLVMMTLGIIVGRLPLGKEVDCLQIIGQSTIYFPDDKDGTIYLAVPTGSNIPFSFFFDYHLLFGNTHLAALLQDQISERYNHYAEKKKREKVTETLLKEQTGQIALSILRKDHEVLQQIKNPPINRQEFKLPSAWSSFRIAGILLGIVICIVIFYIAIIFFKALIVPQVPDVSPSSPSFSIINSLLLSLGGLFG